jgi:hypothetical protein
MAAGFKTGGRVNGTPNKATTARALLAESARKFASDHRGEAMIRIEIEGDIIRRDRNANREGRKQRQKPVHIIQENGNDVFAFGADINGTLRVICPLGNERPYIEVADGSAVHACDPARIYAEGKGYAHIYIDQAKWKNNKRSGTWTPAVIARWNGDSRWAREVVVKGRAEIAYGCSAPYRRSIRLWIQTGCEPTAERWYFERLVASPDGSPSQVPDVLDWNGSAWVGD